MSISIIIPAYNEANAIADVIKRIQAVDKSYEIIVVNDGSTDETADVASALGVTVVSRPGNIGYGKSIKDGLHAASYDTIVISDADGTYPIEDIPKLVQAYNKGYDMVVGARQGVHYWSSICKGLFRFLLRILVEFVAGKHIPDINSGFRIFSKNIALQYEKDLCDTFSFTTTITLIYFLTKRTILYIPISYDKRIGASKVRHFRDSLRTLQYITECIARFNPLKLYVLLSACTICIGCISIIFMGPAGFFISVYASIIVFSLGLLTYGIRS